MNLQEQLSNVQWQLTAEKASNPSNTEKIADLKNQETAILLQIDDEAKQQRVQVQEEKVESITLPYDYNDILGNPLANETIIEVLKQDRLQSYEEHNAEVVRINAEWNDKVKSINSAADEAIAHQKQINVELQQSLDSENEQAQKDAKEITDLMQQVMQLGLEKQDFESKHKAAADALELANQEIERLKQPKPQSSLDIGVNDRLADLAARAKESTLEKANRGLQRWGLPALDVPAIPELPKSENVDPAHVEQNDHSDIQQETTFREEDKVQNTGHDLADQSLSLPGEKQTTEQATVTRAEFQAALERIDRIERHPNIQAA